MADVCGVYEIINTENGKRYVGSSKHMGRRLAEHKRKLNCGEHHSVALQRAWDKYGASAFTFNRLAVLEPEEQFSTEQRLLDMYYTDGYNMGRYVKAALKGRKHSPETLSKMRDGRRAGENSVSFGLKRTAETRKLQSELKKGKPAHNKGVKHTAETIQKIRSALKGRVSWRKGVQSLACKQGHPLTGDNVYVRKDRGTRSCKACNNQRSRAYVMRNNEER